MTAPLLLTVYGTPGPQGSKRHVGGGRMIESSQLVKPWREAVKTAALTEILSGDRALYPIPGPLRVAVFFTLRKPASAPKRTRIWPSKKPDIDKLLRSTFDALSDAGLWLDDAQVIDVRAVKTYPDESVMALASPGAVIAVSRVSTSSPDGPGGAETCRASSGVSAKDHASLPDSGQGSVGPLRRKLSLPAADGAS